MRDLRLVGIGVPFGHSDRASSPSGQLLYGFGFEHCLGELKTVDHFSHVGNGVVVVFARKLPSKNLEVSLAFLGRKTASYVPQRRSQDPANCRVPIWIVQMVENGAIAGTTSSGDTTLCRSSYQDLGLRLK